MNDLNSNNLKEFLEVFDYFQDGHIEIIFYVFEYKENSERYVKMKMKFSNLVKFKFESVIDTSYQDIVSGVVLKIIDNKFHLVLEKYYIPYEEIKYEDIIKGNYYVISKTCEYEIIN